MDSEYADAKTEWADWNANTAYNTGLANSKIRSEARRASTPVRPARQGTFNDAASRPHLDPSRFAQHMLARTGS